MAQHPTILIGHGPFGRTVLRRLLATTAARGALVWQDAPDGSDPAARRLKNLAILGVGGTVRSPGEPANDPEQREIFRDLERQIEEVEPSGETLATAMDRAASRLLAASDRAADPNRLRLGLDVIVVTQPATPEDVGELLNLLARGMSALASQPSLSRVAEGIERLNFLQILDFEQYWDPAERGKRVRQAVHKAVQHWEGQLASRRPGFGRTYLIDSHTQGGFRDSRYRIDEIVLFLELLLFEGQRDGELQWLYQRRRDFEPTVGTFGVRSVERSAGLLGHLAAAAFGVGWLGHLAGAATVEGDADLLDLRRRIQPYRAAQIREFLNVEKLESRRDQELIRLEAALLALSPELPDWPEQIRERAQSALLELKNDLSRWAGDQVRRLDQELLAELPRELEAGVEAALHQGASPATLGRVMAEIEGLVREMEGLASTPPREVATDHDPFAALEAAHQRYREARAEQVDTHRLQRWWLLLSFAVAAAWTPLLLEAAGEVPQPDPAASHLLRWGYDALQWLARPVVAGFLLLASAFAAGRWLLQPILVERVRRALAFHTDPERGRLADRIRGALAPGGTLRARIDGFAAGVVQDLAARVRSDVQREARRVLALLDERRREALWLRDQLLDFLKGYGLDASLQGDGFERSRRRRGSVRQALERGDELQALLERNRPCPERFHSTQIRIQPFRSWAERYCGSFLDPLGFLDGLSTEYQDRGKPTAEPLLAELLEFLRREGSFSPAFDWPRTEGVPVVEAHCLVPADWMALPDLLRALRDHGWTDSRVSRGTAPGRAYLLRVQLGVSPERLLTRQALTAEAR